MANNWENLFKLTQTENLKNDANSSVTRKLTFDDLGDFIEERERVKRKLEEVAGTKLKVDYSTLANHVFFNSAVSKLDVAIDRVLTKYPFNGTTEEKEAHALTSSGYENYLLEQWPRHVGYVHLSGTQYISASDTDNKLFIGTSSLYISAWHKPDVVTTLHPIIQVFSASTGVSRVGYELFLSNSDGDVHAKFSLYSGSTIGSVSASVAGVTSSFSNIGVIYDQPAQRLSIFVNRDKMQSASVSFGSLEFAPSKVYIGSGSRNTDQSIFSFYSGALDEIRVLHTASELYHLKNYSRYIDAEEYVKLYYKFNEGVVGTASVDEGVVDYSKSELHGKLHNYDSNTRISGAVILKDFGDPILYSFHSDVVSFTSSLALSASVYDKENKNVIFRLIPEEVLRADDNASGLLTSFSLAMARYFDELKLYIDQFENVKITNYEDTNETPDLFLPFLTKYFGWKVAEHFNDAASLSFFFGENILHAASGSTDTSLFEIRNQFWRRTLNNLPYLLKTKGKRYNLDAYFNVLGLNKNLFSLKEFGYVQNSSIEDTRIHREKPATFIAIGTGSLSASYVKSPGQVSASHNIYTVETMLQLPYASASYTGSLLTGSVWQFVDSTQVTGSFTLLWRRNSLLSESGSFVLTSSDGQRLTSSVMEIFNGDIVHVAAGLKNNQLPFIDVRTLDNDVIDFSASVIGSVAFSGVFTGSNYDFVIGANSGTTYFQYPTQGYFAEVRHWARALSSSELDAHAYHFESIGTDDVLGAKTLRGHWPFSENRYADSSGKIHTIQDHSLNGRIATGSDFAPSENSYKKLLMEYNFLSPSIDLKWTENKIRVRNKTELTLKDIAKDTNEVALEFNLVDALNEDISKIFSSFDIINNVVGRPVNKYRDEYSDLEAYRRLYFERLSTNVNFTQFFRLFKWFDKKLSDSIKQLLPARARFVGGEQVVESHFLERPRYGYKYPIFRTPVDIPNAELSGVVDADGFHSPTYTGYIQNFLSSSGYVSLPPPATYGDGDELYDRARPISHWELFFETGSNFVSGAEQVNATYASSSGYDFLHGFALDGAAVDVSGNLYVVAETNESVNDFFAVYSSSFPNLGASGSWQNILSYQSSSLNGARAIAIDSSGNMYVAGFHYNFSPGNSRWLVRKSTDKGSTWSTVDDFSGTFNAVEDEASAHCVAIDSNDHVYVGGVSIVDPGPFQSSSFTIRKSTDRGSTWTTIDSYYSGSGDNICWGIAAGSDNHIYAVGCTETSPHKKWIVRKSTTGASGSFVTCDEFGQLDEMVFTEAEALNVTVNNKNHVYVVGYAPFTLGAQGGTTHGNGFLRKSINSGAFWSTVFELSGTTSYSRFYGIDYDTSGHIYFGGMWANVSALIPNRFYEWQVYVYDSNIDQVTLLNSYNYPNNTALEDGVRCIVCFNSGGLAHTMTSNTIHLLAGGFHGSGTTHSRKYTVKKTGGAKFSRKKTTGDTSEDSYNPNNGINFKNEMARKLLTNRERDNE